MRRGLRAGARYNKGDRKGTARSGKRKATWRTAIFAVALRDDL